MLEISKIFISSLPFWLVVFSFLVISNKSDFEKYSIKMKILAIIISAITIVVVLVLVVESIFFIYRLL